MDGAIVLVRLQIIIGKNDRCAISRARSRGLLDISHTLSWLRAALQSSASLTRNGALSCLEAPERSNASVALFRPTCNHEGSRVLLNNAPSASASASAS